MIKKRKQFCDNYLKIRFLISSAGEAKNNGELSAPAVERNVSHKVTVVNRGTGFNLTHGINSLPRLSRPPTPATAYKFGEA